MKKIVLTKKAKEHIALKNDSFIIPFSKLYENCKDEVIKKLNNNDQIQKIHIEFDEPIGIVAIDTFDENDVLILKKRQGYNNYSLFVKNRKNKETNTLTFVISKSFNGNDVFFITTAFPSFGIEIEREVSDKNIKNEEERKKCVKFWSKYAFIYDDKDNNANEYRVSYSDALKFINNGGKADLVLKYCNGKREFELKIN